MIPEKRFGSRLPRAPFHTHPRRYNQPELGWMILPDTRCPPSTHAARDWGKGARLVIHQSSVLLSFLRRTNPSPEAESRVPGFLRNRLRVWQRQRFGIGNRPQRAQRTRKSFQITTYNPANRNASQATIRRTGVNCSQYGGRWRVR